MWWGWVGREKNPTAAVRAVLLVWCGEAGKAGGWEGKNLTAAVRAVLLFGVVGVGWEGKKLNCSS